MVTTKTKATHTPGPWKVANVATRGIPQLKVETSESGMWDRADIAKLNVSNKESEANARLIAFAPEMLETLELIACGYCPNCGCDLCNTKGCPSCSMVRGVRAVVARAKGETYTEPPILDADPVNIQNMMVKP